jgi:hypothetical protein
MAGVSEAAARRYNSRMNPRAIFVLSAALLAAASPAGAFPIPIDPYPPKTVHEYYNEYTKHFVLLSDPAEISGVEAGAAGPGWKRTGYSFAANNETLAAPNVCRFYAPGVNSHFFTANAQECAFLRDNNTGWIFEKLDFSVDVPLNGACAAGRTPILRLYNNRAAQNDSSHRFVPDAAVRDDLVAESWRDEGVAFCAQSAYRQPLGTAAIATSQIRPTAECENESINLGPCIALNQIPVLPNQIDAWAPPWYVTRGANYSPLFGEITGNDGNLHTAQSPGDTSAVAAHSFVQTTFTSGEFGIHVSYLDRTFGSLASINPLYQFTTSAPAPGAPDARVYPWRHGLQNDLVVSFNLRVKTLRRLAKGSQAYGHPTLQFLDTASGQHLYVTLGAYGTDMEDVPGPPLLMVDSATNRVIVGTLISANAAFGKRLAGGLIRCDRPETPGTCEALASDAFAFRLNRDAFRKVLEFARSVRPLLSANPEDYVLANFHFNNEIYLSAELGLTLANYKLELFGY